MFKKVTDALMRFDMLKDCSHITVALSGGADSMALIHVLLALQTELNIGKISAAHFNHQIRGDEAMHDQLFVQKYCEKIGVDCFVGSADVVEYSKQNNLSLELAARKLRYEFFESLDTELIATAHTASDNIETVIFNLTRGASLSGLCGIPPVRDKYIRPLIFCTREDIETYCQQNGLQFVTDSTNLCDDYTRNKVRHNVIPVLKEINQSTENAVSRMTISLRETEDFIDNIVDEIVDKRMRDGVLSVDGFCEIHPAIAKRVIAKYCSKNNIEIDYFHINSVYDICLSGGKVSLPQDMVGAVQNGFLKIQGAKSQSEKVNFSVDIEQCDNVFFENTKKIHNLLLKNIIDCDKIVGELQLRTRQTGDEIRLKNKNGTKTLKKLFCEYKIPLEERENLPVLSDDIGVVWVHKIGVSERCASDENSKQVYKINVKKI